MAITIFDYVKAVIGEKPQYTGEDFSRCGVDMLGGCEYCHATIGPWNAYPSKSGYWRCGDCVANTGYPTIREFTDQVMGDFKCPRCGTAGYITSVYAATVSDAEAFAFTCGHCATSWTRLA